MSRTSYTLLLILLFTRRCVHLLSKFSHVTFQVRIPLPLAKDTAVLRHRARRNQL